MSPVVPFKRMVLAVVAVGVVLAGVVVLGVVMAITGAGLGCSASGSAGGESVAGIPADRLALYRQAGRRFDIDWAFLASIGAQECHHRTCAGDNGSGCAGPMQIAVRRHSPCSPGGGETLWERYGVDADHDQVADPDDPADAIFTAARILRQAKHAPPAGGSYKDYYNAACAYYGACGDATADYADQVMARAVVYGFGDPATTSGGGCGGGGQLEPLGAGMLGEVVRDRGPGGRVALPISITGGAAIECDRRIRDDVIWLARRFHVLVSACYAIHASAGEHPLGAAVDLVPDGNLGWQQTTARLARAVGWKRSCAAAGVAPACAHRPFRFVGYTGFPGHGDPQHCRCQSPHLHLSWLTSASEGQPQNAARSAYFAPDWIDIFATDAEETGR